MSRCRAVLVSAMTAMVLPSLPAYPAQPTPPSASSDTSATLQLQVPAAEAQAPAAPTQRVENRAAAGLKLEYEGPPYSTFSRHDNHGYGFASGAAPSSALNLSSASATRPGWQLSGRAGPVRWLAPLDGEGETKMRFGGRVPGQPRLPGMGLFNVSVHYAFE